MNKKDLEEKKNHKLFIIGSARGVNRFYVTNKFIENFPNAKVINTGVLINKLAEETNMGKLDRISLNDYVQHLEPIFIQTILNHLEHGDVILDTHFYHLMPCISIKGLQSFIERLSKAILVLVNDSPIQIYKENKGNGDLWFDLLENVKYDVSCNEIYFRFYQEFFSRFISQNSISISLENEKIEKIENFIGEVKTNKLEKREIGKEKYNGFSLSAFTFVFNKDFSKILLIKRNEEKRKKWGFDWGIIGGKVEIGELSNEAVIREIKEEIGIEVNSSQLKFLWFEERPSKVHTSAVHFFYTAVIDENSDIKINEESDEYSWYEIKNVPTSMIETPDKIRNAINLAIRKDIQDE